MSRLNTLHLKILYSSFTDCVEILNMPEANYSHFLFFSYSSGH
jgi:hypothetical protein